MHLVPSISPLDGRYYELLSSVRNYGSEQALVVARGRVEIAWLIQLAKVLPQLQDQSLQRDIAKFTAHIEEILTNSQDAFFAQVKEREVQTNHDVKALEYALAWYAKELLGHDEIAPWIHFGLTSEDINNLAWNLVVIDLQKHCLAPAFAKVIGALCDLAETNAKVAMLSRTHGQPASPTTVGKEIAVFAHRLSQASKDLNSTEFTGKISGAVGAYNAVYAAAPKIDWPAIAAATITSLGCQQIPISTQIEPHDTLARYLYSLASTCGILTDTVRDFWHYISLEYFGLKVIGTEVGSSTMPHKVNPIHFENAEGNLGIAIALAQHLACVLQTSRLQRDLCDSTRLRNLPSLLGYVCLALHQLESGLSRLSLNSPAIERDLDCHWEVLTEPLMTLLRSIGRSDGYEVMKQASRGTSDWSREDYLHFVESLNLKGEALKTATQFTPFNYTGNAAETARQVVRGCREG